MQILPLFRTPDDVTNIRAEIDAYVTALQAVVDHCPSLDIVTRVSWDAFVLSWRTFCQDEPSWWHTASQYEKAEDFKHAVAGWQAKLGAVCSGGAPPIETASPTFAGVSEAFRTMAFAGVIVAAVVAVRAISK